MITRGSKYFLGAAAAAFLTALVYGFITGASANGGVIEVFSNGGLVNSIIGPITFGWKGWVGDQIGYSVLMGFAGAMAVLGGLTSVFRDGSPEALAQLQGVTVEPGEVPGVGSVDLRVVTPQGLSFQPILGAFSIGAVVVGLAVSSALVVVGAIGLVVVTVEWTMKAWSERATGDPVTNAEIRNRMMRPLEIPIGATLAAALIVFSMSRILLAVPKVGAVFVIILVAVAVFGTAILLASRPHLKRSVLVAAVLLFGLLIIGGGIAGGVAGQREEEQHAEEESLQALPDVGTAATAAAGHDDTDGPAVGY